MGLFVAIISFVMVPCKEADTTSDKESGDSKGDNKTGSEELKDTDLKKVSGGLGSIRCSEKEQCNA